MEFRIFLYIFLVIGIMLYYYFSREKEDQLEISLDFKDNKSIPVKYTAEGRGLSPPIKFKNISEKAQSIVIIVEDISNSEVVTHWLIWNISSEIKQVPAGVSKEKKFKKTCQGKNDFGFIGYKGPVASGQTHIYRFRFFTLDEKLNLKAGIKKETLEKRMVGSILQRKSIRAKYGVS